MADPPLQRTRGIFKQRGKTHGVDFRGFLYQRKLPFIAFLHELLEDPLG